MNELIKDYLERHGSMSGKDITIDLDVDEWDIECAEDTGLIQRVEPEPGGTGAWYAAR